jgi:16S rRNA (guanine527-N7)-methyltransferase
MDEKNIAALLVPYVGADALSAQQLDHVSKYLALLLKWNAKMNLTSVRKPEEIISRHFGESFFAARTLLDDITALNVIDLGSGAGFPGLPMAIFAPRATVTLIESQNKKATFLKEVARALGLPNVKVFGGRGEDFKEKADLVIMRAVEKFENAAAVAAGVVGQKGKLGLLIGEAQVGKAREILQAFTWESAKTVPESASRVLLVGNRW